jgi:hypothetical protein
LPSTDLSVSSMGAFAARILDQGGPASVHGRTSRGCFLQVRSRWVLFLTSEIGRGPLTLNLRGDNGALQALRPATPVEIQFGSLQFDSVGLRLELGQAVRWEPPARPGAWLSGDERRERQVAVGKELLAEPGAAGTGRLVAHLLDLPTPTGGFGEPVFSLEEVARLRVALKSQDGKRVLSSIEWFLGRGPGLTPAGDDLVAGLLLALHRWGNVLCPGLDPAELSGALLPLAYHKTSTLAANLIECAIVGQADERLVTALDGLMTGHPNPGECADLLLDYGSSSGCDAFLGMLLVEDFSSTIFL